MKSEQTEQAKPGYFQWTTEEGTMRKAVQHFEENGYVILKGFAHNEEIQEMRKAAADIIEGFHSNAPPHASIFTTYNQVKSMENENFLNSSSQVTCFLEEKDRSQVNKIGHALHELVPAFEKFSFDERVNEIAKRLGVKQARLIQSMYILKNAQVGAEVRPHRDSTFIRNNNNECLGYWWALEDSTLDNGCLWAVPKSHRHKHNRRFVLDHSSRSLEFKGQDNNSYSDDDYVALPMRSGDLILLHGDVMHMSKANTSGKSRHAYSIHVVSDNVASDCWLQRPIAMPFKFIDDLPLSNDLVTQNTIT